jgi:DNA-binding GntR family transcriptional regulator
MGEAAVQAGRQPRYRQLADALMAEIRDGRIRVGQTLPGELELVARHAVSRHTVREALRLLEDLGLIDRHQGIGTVVRARESRESYVQTLRTPFELMHYPEDSRLHVVATERVRLARRLAKLLGVRVGSEWVRASAVRRLKGSRVPMAWTDIYILPDYASVVELIGRKRQMVYELIEQQHGERLAAVQVDIRAGIVTAALAGPLECAVGTPSLTVIRRYSARSRRVFQVSVSEHPADRYTYSLELRRGWQSADTWSTT